MADARGVKACSFFLGGAQPRPLRFTVTNQVRLITATTSLEPLALDSIGSALQADCCSMNHAIYTLDATRSEAPWPPTGRSRGLFGREVPNRNLNTSNIYY